MVAARCNHSMTRFALTLEFDGTPFMGLQRQPQGPTVQSAVEAAVLAVTGETVTLHAAGRTDAGVHAKAMCAHREGMDAGIGPTRRVEDDRLASDRQHRRLDRRLHRRPLRLALEPHKRRAVEFEGEGEAGHRRTAS